MIVKCAPSIRNWTESGTVSFLECQWQLRLTKSTVEKNKCASLNHTYLREKLWQAVWFTVADLMKFANNFLCAC